MVSSGYLGVCRHALVLWCLSWRIYGVDFALVEFLFERSLQAGAVVRLREGKRLLFILVLL